MEPIVMMSIAFCLSRISGITCFSIIVWLGASKKYKASIVDSLQSRW